MHVPGVEDYEVAPGDMVERYEALLFEDVHRNVMHLMPSGPCRVLDIGAGTGRDAAWFAARGCAVLAVEPADALREAGLRLHPHPTLEWLYDGLPDLQRLKARKESFDLVMLTGVWMHLDAEERSQAMPIVAAQVGTGGRLIFSLRHGAIPKGRRMFDVKAAEMIELANTEGLRLIFQATNESIQAGSPVVWTRLAFERPHG